MAMGLGNIVRKAAVPFLIAGTIATTSVFGACTDPEPVNPPVTNPPIDVPTPEPPVVTPEDPGPTISEYRQFLIDNPEASEGFSEAQFSLAEKLLSRASEVMKDPEFYEGLNASVKGLTLDSSIQLDSDKDLDDIVMPLWNYVYNGIHKGEDTGSIGHRTVTIDGKEYSSLSKTALSERLPHEKDREIYYMELFNLDGLKYATPSTEWGDWLTSTSYDREKLQKLPYYDAEKYGKEAITENLANMTKLAENMVQVNSNPDLFLHTYASSGFEHTIPAKAFPNTKLANAKYVQLYRERGDKELELAMFVHGISRIIYGEDKIAIDRILSGSLGIPMFEQRAPYNNGIPGHGTHGEPLFFIPKYILDKIEANPDKYGTPMVFRGQTIGFVPNYEVTGKEQDNIPYVKFSTLQKATYLQLNEKYNMKGIADLTNPLVELIQRKGLESERKNIK